MAGQLGRRLGMPRNTRKASTVPPPTDGQNSFFRSFMAVAAVVVMVNTSVCAPLVIVTEGEARLHDAGSVEAFLVTAQVRFTVPVNPPDGVTVIVE
jgi:hypothetical protein